MAIVGVLLLWPDSAALAQRGWTGVTTTISSADQSSAEPRVAVGGGHAVAVWEAGGFPEPIHAARRALDDDGWSPPVLISPGGQRTVLPRVGLDRVGNATVTWLQIADGRLILQAVRGNASTGAWSPPVDLSGDGSAHDPEIAVADNGDVFVVWTRFDGGAYSVHARRFDAEAGTWSATTDLSPAVGDAYRADIGVSPDGDATAVWTHFDGSMERIQAACYVSSAGTWGSAASISAGAPFAGRAHVGLDAMGHATAVWVREGVVETARFTSDTGTWSAVSTLSAFSQHATDARVAVDASGNAVTVWPGFPGVFATRYRATAGTWDTVQPLSGSVTWESVAEVAMDDAGNATALWTDYDSGPRVLRTARFSSATGNWGPALTLAPAAREQHLAMDEAGHVVVVWQRDSDRRVIQATQWQATPGAPAITTVAAGIGAIAAAFDAPTTVEGPFAPTNYQYSIDDGATWVSRDPASTSSPVEIAGLTGGVPHRLRLRAINSAGAGSASVAVTATPGPAPGPPTDLVAMVSGNSVTLTWASPTGSVVPNGYVLEGGVGPGQVLASVPTAGLATAFTFAAPTGAFYVRVHAVAGALRSVASNEIRIFVNTLAPPSSPTNLLGLAVGGSLALSWTNTSSGGTPTSLWLNVAGGVNATLALPIGEMFSLSAVPPGTYTMSVTAANAAGTSPPSNAVTLMFPGVCTSPPGMPTNLVVSKRGATIDVSWMPPASGTATAGYVVMVSGAYVGSVATTARTLSGTVGPGVYTLSVVATNTCGLSAATPAQTVTIP